MSGAELRSVGIDTVEKLRNVGWDVALERLVAFYPTRATVNMARALIGAVEDLDWRKVAPRLVDDAEDLVKRLKAESEKSRSE